WEVAGYWVALVTRRADQFRMNRLKDTFKERAENTAVEVADGIQVKESVEYTNRTWSDNLMYLPYPDMDSQKNPNLVR
ncbi:RagB/SusD family nutrient uptake outer membrane protein, partial [Bacteroides fragilis]|nr:RagB/SusD family nutrient uptake outer membrane protein [Bacteroides fragilis]MCY6332971.1 RagB/SusD family nutrient uptake outer membrane protein [Bacteroides fragilis]MCY6340730.1 RagB/SusD family nutrient uptake outer membrane protein [Bacteroides fragilis]MCY6353529.1 RagB/SusD family nutrient uptake outer membrane protein [Bacteroides fragilis]